MAKYKSKIKSGGGAKPAAPAATRGLIPCGLLVLGGIILFSYLFYSLLSSSTTTTPAPAANTAPAKGPEAKK